MNPHAHIFDDLIGTLQGALQDMGCDCTRAHNMMKAGRINILIGDLLGLWNKADALNDLSRHPYIVYQLEQMDSKIGLAAYNPHYHQILKQAALIWDYSPANLAFLERSNLKGRARFLPPGYHRSLEQFTLAEPLDIDVLFYGSPSERRARVIEQLRAAGVNVVTLFGVYGERLHDHLRRAKIVLNVHGMDNLSVLETVRLSLLLANRCFVVSEVGDYNPYGDGLVFAEYDQLAQTCLRWLRQTPDARRAVTERGHAAIRRIDMGAHLAREIEALPIDALSPAPIPR
jgi:hypothetical protein